MTFRCWRPFRSKESVTNILKLQPGLNVTNIPHRHPDKGPENR